MKMPGRSGALSANGLWQQTGSESALPANPSYDSRTGNTPPEYKATESITFLPGFESGENDAFEAYITQDAGSGGSAGGSGVYASGGYRYGFNGKENDNEVKGEGNQQDYGMRIYDPRLGRFLSVDPLEEEYPELTPYQFASNTPVQAADLDGMEADYKGKIRNATPQEREDYPVWSFFKDFSAYAINYFSPFGAIDDAIDTWKDPKASTGQKIDETLNILPALVEPFDRPGKAPQPHGASGPHIEPVASKEPLKTPKETVPQKVTQEKPVQNTNKQVTQANHTNTQAANANAADKKVSDPTYNRVKLKKATLEKVKENQPRNENGQMIDPNTKKPLQNGQIDVGHKSGQEWRVRKKMHQEKGSTRKEVIKTENDPNLYQLENRSSNRSHKHEQKTNN
jgi:RHS repeat-associated protein